MAPRVVAEADENGKSSTSPLLAVADWTDFRSLETLPRKGGVSLTKLPALIVKEVVDNALDASGNASVERIGPNGFRVEDDDPGIDLDDAAIARHADRQAIERLKVIERAERDGIVEMFSGN